MPTAAVLSLILLALGIESLATASAGLPGDSSDILPPQSVICANFTGTVDVKDGFNIFHTPGYNQGRYPNKTSCVKLITTAFSSAIIVLEFRNRFFIEDSSRCEHDFLEVRDGPYGYSTLLGRFCGQAAPSQIRSTGKFMWLQFSSDASIEHQGMKAAHKTEMAASSKKECRMPLMLLGSPQLIVTQKELKKNFPESYQNQPSQRADCTIDVIAPPGTRILVSLENLRVRSDEKCNQQAVSIYDGFTTGLPKPLCSTLEPKQKRLLTATSRAIVRVTAKDTYFLPEFLVAFTAVRVSDSCQKNTEFRCGLGCVDSRLKCNGHINCLEGEDEAECVDTQHTHGTDEQPKDAEGGGKQEPPAKSEMSYHPIILGSIGTGFLVLTLVCCCVTLKQRLRERRQMEAEAPRTPVKSLSRGPSFHREPADESLVSQTALASYPGYSCHGDGYAADAVRQNGTLAPATPASVRSAAGASARLAATPSKVRVSKFLEPAGPDCPAESPIEMFGAEGPPYSAQLVCGAQHGHSRSLPRSIMKQESFDTSASSRDADVSYRAFAFPPPPPPPPPQASERRQHSVPPDSGIVQSRSIPGQLAGSATENAFAVGHQSPRCLRRQQQQQQQQQQQLSGRPGSRRTTKRVFQA